MTSLLMEAPVDLQCPTCDATFKKRTYQQRYCSDVCRSKGKAAAQKAARHAVLFTRSCPVCGADLTGRRASVQYCSESHARLARRIEHAAHAPPCAVDECDEAAVARGWCHHHWYGWRAHGDPLAASRRGPNLPLEQRLWAGVDTTGDCWVWTRSTADFGYGKIGDGSRVRGTHVVSWELTNGPVPEGLWVLHRCDNPPCVRPEHLFLGTAADNNQDMIRKGRAAWQRELR